MFPSQSASPLRVKVPGSEGTLTATDIPEDQPETTEVWVAHLAWALTKYEPSADQVWEALEEGDQGDKESSPQSKRYSTECPKLDIEPPVE